MERILSWDMFLLMQQDGEQREFFWINTHFICWIGTQWRFQWVHESFLGVVVVLAFEFYWAFDVYGFCFWMIGSETEK